MMKLLRDMNDRELDVILGQVNAELEDIAAQRKRKALHLNEIQAERTRRKEDKAFNPTVSDHALLRYMERVMGVEVEELRVKLLTPSMLSAMRANAKKYTADGITFLLAGNKIITVLDR